MGSIYVFLTLHFDPESCELLPRVRPEVKSDVMPPRSHNELVLAAEVLISLTAHWINKNVLL